MGRLIILDHSLVDLQGHHYECSISLAEAAQRGGEESLIVANRVFAATNTTNIPIIPAFAVDWFDRPTPELTESPALTSKVTLSIGAEITRQLENSVKGQLLLEKIAGSTSRLGAWIQEDLRLIRQIPLTNTAWGLFKILWGSVRFAGGLAGKMLGKVRQRLNPSPVIDHPSFIATVAHIVTGLGLTDTDQVLIHTIGIAQVAALSDYLSQFGDRPCPTFHLLMRRDTQDPLVNPDQGLQLKDCLKIIYQRGLWPNKIRFYTDTPTLVKNYNALSPIQFQQVPIPFRQEKLTLAPLSKTDGVLTLVYLGDARTEKGYQHLPNVVEALWPDYLAMGKVRFVIQSNYTINGLEGPVLQAKLRLSQYPQKRVKLIDQALTPEEYYQLLVSADLVILPYDPVNYQRTSGVLTEALAAGKPVVVPANSWLAEQVDASRAGIYQDPQDLPQTVIKALENLDDLAIAAQEFAPQWKTQQSPDRFIDALTKPFGSDRANPQLPPGILAILSLEHLDNVNPSSPVLWEMLRFWAQQGYRLYCLLDNSNGGQNFHDQGDIAANITVKLNALGIERIWSVAPMSAPENLAELPDNWRTRYELLTTSQIPTAVSQLIDAQLIDTVYLGQTIYQAWLDQLPTSTLPKAIGIETFASDQAALSQQQAPDQAQLALEINVLNSAQVIITPYQYFAETLQELLGQKTVISLSQALQSPQLTHPQERAEFYQQLQHLSQQWLGEQALPITSVKPSPRVAVLYPWGDIQERCSGASQRTGQVIDFLQEQGVDLTVFSLNHYPNNWQHQVNYRYYQPSFAQAPLVHHVYQNAFFAWQDSLNLSPDLTAQFSPITPTELDQTWLPWIYYSLRFDPLFTQQLATVIDWADVVLLEYPFWAAIAGPLCRQKGVKLILTAHDVLAKQLKPGSLLAQIALTEELQGLKQADHVVTLSPDDQQFFQCHGIDNHCVPIGIDVRAHQADARPELWETLESEIGIDRDWQKPICLFVGSQHPPNVEAVGKIQAIAGENAGNWEAIAVGSCCDPTQTRNFYALGKVSEPVLQMLYQRAAVVLIPLEAGTGMSVKTLEAMAYGKVILGTAIAFRGYPVQSGVHCVINNDLGQYGAEIEKIIQHPTDYQAIAANAQTFAQAYDYRQLYQLYLDLIHAD
jgi:glycosyltransferase involved in cell wall biosynthesis